ncbi:hypothetical protein [Kribbella soli]|uniref:Uncharacterized protein n=1 Tax=Kribbella soli TaxID=1124743 RepID=A0A4R0H5K3_9ACTN|nr:hypothetical protein [Kribbella soli]TCC03732.1 hypothetical protein E0H45_31935 [Kribbella soli]
MNRYDAVQEIADALLFEGYVLYPYRASDGKNRVRWQFGVLMPPDYSLVDPSERSWSQTEALLDGDKALIRVRLRFLQAQSREVLDADRVLVTSLETEDATYRPWDEAVVRTVDLATNVYRFPREVTFKLPGGTDVEAVGTAGFLRRTRLPITGTVTLTVETLPGPYNVARIRVRVENTTPDGSSERVGALRQALIAHHVMVAADGSRFISQLDPPEWARGFAGECENIGLYPVLAGDLLLSSPIILYDHPTIAPESQGDLFDATEIDEILSLRTMTLTDEEKREVRGTDPRAAELLDRVDTMPPEFLDRLHGTIRYLRKVTEPPPADQPWWDPGNDSTVSPETDTVQVGEVAVGNGTRVRLRPGIRRADAQDMFLTGRFGTVVAVLSDVDGDTHVAVALDGEEGEVQRSHGRYLYFSPDELEPVT